jgi:hypothetical protein
MSITRSTAAIIRPSWLPVRSYHLSRGTRVYTYEHGEGAVAFVRHDDTGEQILYVSVFFDEDGGSVPTRCDPRDVMPIVGKSGYCDCACRDCFDITVSSDATKPALCGECLEAGCDAAGASDCERSPDEWAVDGE